MLVKEQIIREVKDLITAYFESQGVELIDLILRYEGNKLILTILADKPAGDGLATDKPQGNGLASFGQSHSQSHRPEGGITLGECALLNRQLGAILEEKNIIDCDYILEVSSPGLDRNLKTQKDFLRCLNKEVMFFLSDLINGKCQWQGLINRVEENSVFINALGQVLEIPLIKINKAKLVIE